MTLAPPAIRVTVNDRQLPVVAVFEHGRVLVPLRGIVEALGGHVSAFHLPLPPPARIIAGRYYAPIRAVANAMNAQIQYDARTHLVQVFTMRNVAIRSGPTVPTVTFTEQPLSTSPPMQSYSTVYSAPYQAPLQLNVFGNEFFGGDAIQVELIAPPGGQAFASVCTAPYEFPLYASPNSQYYTGSVSTGTVSNPISCPITARYVGWNGATSYAPYPVFISLLPFATPKPTPQPTPAPTSTPRRVPLPPIRRATPEPSPTPTPVQQESPGPAPRPVERRTPEPREKPTAAPVEKKTPAPDPTDSPEPRRLRVPSRFETPSPNSIL